MVIGEIKELYSSGYDNFDDIFFSRYKNKNTSSVSLNSPDKINLYIDGKQKQITKNGDKWKNEAFMMEDGKLCNIVGIKENLDYLVKSSFDYTK